MIHFELNFVKGIRAVYKLIFFSSGCPIVPAPLVENIIIAPLF